jgi:hypothetical protein
MDPISNALHDLKSWSHDQQTTCSGLQERMKGAREDVISELRRLRNDHSAKPTFLPLVFIYEVERAGLDASWMELARYLARCTDTFNAWIDTGEHPT